MRQSHVLDAAVRNLPTCPHCGEAQGNPCRTPGWKVVPPHREREAALLAERTITTAEVLP